MPFGHLLCIEVMAIEKIIIPVEVEREYRNLLRMTRFSVHPIDIQKIRQAFTLVTQINRANNLPDNHPLMFQSLITAQIVISEIGLGTTSTLSAIFYGFVEKKLVEIDKLKELFGTKVALMLSEMLQITQIDVVNSQSQAENFRKLLLTFASDLRVILVKLAERIFLMRNLDTRSREEQLAIASATAYLYAPLGHRLGLYRLKSELEDLAMRYLDPQMYSFIQHKLEETATERNRFIREFIEPIRKDLDDQNFDFEIKGRTKSVTSIYNKMKKQNVEFEEVYDIFAIRIILNSELKNEKADCWRVFSAVTSRYQPNPLRMRDWVSVPKSNGYESLHATVVGPEGRWVEVQIRTRRMDEIAEKGLAAHWKYKGQKSDQGLDDWINKVREVLENPDTDSLNFMDQLKLSLYSKDIFVFTPKGDLKKLPKGATILDFAFDIHSNVGSSCVGAKVNGKSVPIRYVLNNGDRIEIFTSKNQKPKSDWLDFVVTSKAISKIKLSLKEELMAQAEQGREILQRRLRNWKIAFNDQAISILLKELKLKTAIDLYHGIATEKFDLAHIKEILVKIEKEAAEAAVTGNAPIPIGDMPIDKIINDRLKESDDILVIDEKVSNVDYRLAKCCNPIMGDDIFGFVTIGEGIKIHRTNCPNATQMISRYGYRVVTAAWSRNDGGQTNFPAAIRVVGYDEIGIVSRLSDVISKDLKVNMRGLSIDTDKGMFEGIIRLFVKDVSHLDVLINKIKKVSGVTSASRIDAS
jgi:GTP diphosphokinase / guanosine-3',5'-bis(diphosphate) 3'-diphosphatase